MNISPTGAPVPASALMVNSANSSASLEQGIKQKETTEVARQFESILVRQILSESMKGLLDGGKAGDAYGYFLTEALADGITKGGGLGIRSIIESQLRQREDVGAPPPQQSH